MVLGWTIRVRGRSRRWAAVLPVVAGFGLSLAQSEQSRDGRTTAGHLARLLAWAGVLAAVTLLTASVWWLLPSWLPISFALRLH